MSKQYKIQAGDTLESIAKRFERYSIDAIATDRDNANIIKALNATGLLPVGQQLVIPDRVPARFTVPSNQQLIFQRRELTMRLVVIVRDEDGEPYAGCDYEIMTNESPEPISGTTDENGVVDELIPVTDKARLQVYTVPFQEEDEVDEEEEEEEEEEYRGGDEGGSSDDESYIQGEDEDHDDVVEFTLRVGALPDVREPLGAKRRLHNLGYTCRNLEENAWDEESWAAAKRFMLDHLSKEESSTLQTEQAQQRLAELLVEHHDGPREV